MNDKLQKIDDYHWRLSPDYKTGMRVPGLIFTNEKLLAGIISDQALEQVANVATLPGIVKASLAMPDIHWGYGFPIGGVAATRVSDGVVSPGGVGFDINCGVRLLRTALTWEDVKSKQEALVNELFRLVPTGIGSSGKLNLSRDEMRKMMMDGAGWAVKQGYGAKRDLDHLEENGCMEDANPDAVSNEAVKRGHEQLGTLGSGNHFLEVEVVDEIYDSNAARIIGIENGQLTILIHTGSRGFGHQVATDYIAVMGKALHKYGINLPDRQLACTPVESPEGEAYLGAMRAAANFAFANRQCITHWVREAFEHVFGIGEAKLGIEVIYDVAHNIAKIEDHAIEGKGKPVKLCIHRKGAVRAFPAGHPQIPQDYQSIGQPIPVPGDMGRYSYLLVGGPAAMSETFGTTCHGAGRQKSRSQAKREIQYHDLVRELSEKGIMVRASSHGTVVEEAPSAYKNISDVVDVAHGAGLSLKVARLRPVAVIKG